MAINRKVTLSVPKQIDADTQITGGSIDYTYWTDAGLRPHLRGGEVSEWIPLEGLSPADQKLVEDFMALQVRLTAEEITNGTAKTTVAEKRDRK